MYIFLLKMILTFQDYLICLDGKNQQLVNHYLWVSLGLSILVGKTHTVVWLHTPFHHGFS